MKHHQQSCENKTNPLTTKLLSINNYNNKAMKPPTITLTTSKLLSSKNYNNKAVQQYKYVKSQQLQHKTIKVPTITTTNPRSTNNYNNNKKLMKPQ